MHARRRMKCVSFVAELPGDFMRLFLRRGSPHCQPLLWSKQTRIDFAKFRPSNLSDHYFQMPFETCHSPLLEQSAQTELSGCKRGSRLAPEVNTRVCVCLWLAENLSCQGLRIIPNHPSSHLTRVTCQSPSWLHPSKDQRRLETAHISNAGRVRRSQTRFCEDQRRLGLSASFPFEHH